MMKTIYLKDGRMADLVTKTDKGYLVDPYITWNDYEGQAESAPSGNVELVDKIYDTAPVELIEAEYKKVLDKVEEQNKILSEQRDELYKINNEISRLKNTKTDLSRYIINREELRNAKRLIVFKERSIVPTVLDGQKSHKFSVSYDISQYYGEEKCWSYSLHMENRDYGWSSGTYFDSQYGIKIDLTDEEIKALAMERLAKKPKDYFYDDVIRHTPDEWLNEEFLLRKRKLIEQFNRVELEKAEKELKAAQEKLEKLQSKDLVLS